MDLVISDNFYFGLMGGIDGNVQFCFYFDFYFVKCILFLNRSFLDIDICKVMIESLNLVISNLLQDVQFNFCVDYFIEILLQSVILRVFNQVIWVQIKRFDSEFNVLFYNLIQQIVEISFVVD